MGSLFPKEAPFVSSLFTAPEFPKHSAFVGSQKQKGKPGFHAWSSVKCKKMKIHHHFLLPVSSSFSKDYYWLVLRSTRQSCAGLENCCTVRQLRAGGPAHVGKLPTANTWMLCNNVALTGQSKALTSVWNTLGRSLGRVSKDQLRVLWSLCHLLSQPPPNAGKPWSMLQVSISQENFWGWRRLEDMQLKALLAMSRIEAGLVAV